VCRGEREPGAACRSRRGLKEEERRRGKEGKGKSGKEKGGKKREKRKKRGKKSEKDLEN
jgi:hypothetical protein